MNPSPDFAFVRLYILASIPKEDFEQQENVLNLLYYTPRNVIIYLFRDQQDIYFTYKGSFQVCWDNSIPLFLHAVYK